MGGLPSSSSNGAPAYANGQNGGRPGQGKPRAPPGSAPREDDGRNVKGKGKKDRRGAKRGEDEAQQAIAIPPPVVVEPEAPVVESVDPVAKKIRNLLKKVRRSLCHVVVLSDARALTSSAIVSSLQLKAIDELKEKLGKGEKLEATQVLKIKK